MFIFMRACWAAPGAGGMRMPGHRFPSRTVRRASMLWLSSMLPRIVGEASILLQRNSQKNVTRGEAGAMGMGAREACIQYRIASWGKAIVACKRGNGPRQASRFRAACRRCGEPGGAAHKRYTHRAHYKSST